MGQEAAEEEAAAAGEQAKAAMEKSKFKKDQKKSAAVDRKAAKAEQRLKTAEANTEAAAVRREKANQRYATAKYKHAYNQLTTTSKIPEPDATPPPKSNLTLSHPGKELEIRLAAQEKNVADLEYEKAVAEEKEARYEASLLKREARAAKLEDGKDSLKAEREARDDLKVAAKEQEHSNNVFQREEKAISKSDQDASDAVASVLSAKTGLSEAKQKAKSAEEAALVASSRAKHSAAEARRLSLKLRDAIDRSASAVADIDRHAQQAMEVVLPAEVQKSADAWSHAKKATAHLKRFEDMVKKGREHMSSVGNEMRKADIERSTSFAKAIDSADSKLQDAIRSVASSQEELLPPSADDPVDDVEDVYMQTRSPVRRWHSLLWPWCLVAQVPA